MHENMRLLILITLCLMSTSCLGKIYHYDRRFITVYEELGCHVFERAENDKPIAYNCEHVEAYSKDKCRVGGKLYGNGEILPNTDKCEKCVCQIINDEPTISCVKLSCPKISLLDYCYTKCSLTECCPTLECDNRDRFLYVEDGIEYAEGDCFQPKNTCMACVIERDFDGDLNKTTCRTNPCQLERKFAERLKDNPEMLYECAPVYQPEDQCCPSDYLCNFNTDAGTSDGIGAGCTHNGQFFERGMSFIHADDTNVHNCTCLTPPLLSCQIVELIN